MPKLKKHADRQIDLPELRSPESEKEVDETEAEDYGHESNSFVPPRMKMSDRIKQFERQTKKRQAKNSKRKKEKSAEDEENAPQLGQDSQINKFISKYTDEDDIDQNDKKKGRGKSKREKVQKPDIKTKNKMFSDYNFQESKEQQKLEDFQQLNIQVEKKTKRNSDELLGKFQKKASFMKNKLDHKDLNQDERYKKIMTQKLKEIKEAEEINLVIGPTKIFGGSNKADIEGALDLKNIKDKSTQELTTVDQKTIQKEVDENTMNMDRKTYFEELGKKLKMKKAETITQSVLKQRFKKSMLDDQDYIHDFKDNQNITSFTEVSQSSYSNQINVKGLKKTKSRSKDYSVNGNNESNRESFSYQQRNSRGNNRVSEHSIKYKKEIKEAPEQISLKAKSEDKLNLQNDENKPNNEDNSIKQRNSIEIKIKKEKPAQNIKRKINSFKYKKLIEVEAEISDDEEEGGPKHNDDQYQDSDIEDDTNLHSLIDDDVEINDKDRENIHQKFIKDQIEDEEKRYQEMRQKKEKKYIEEEENMRKRMEEAAKRNMERDKNEENQLYAGFIPDDDNSKSVMTSNTARQLQNEEKIKQLQTFLNGDPKVEKKVSKESIGASGKLDDLQKMITSVDKSIGFRKAERKGMQNVKAHKKPVLIPKKK